MRDDGVPTNPFPTAHQLRAALRAADVVLRHDGRPSEELDPAFVRTPTDAVFWADDLRLGARLLVEAGFAELAGAVIDADPSLNALLGLEPLEACTLLADRLLTVRRPLWATAATSEGRFAPELIPDDAARGLAELLPDLAQREAFLLALGRRFSAGDRKRVGDLAEAHVVRACRAELEEVGRFDLVDQVRHVSLVSDELGYDVTAPTERGGSRRLEVKATRAERLTVAVFLSRNEARAAMRDPDWYLVLCRVAPDETVRLAGWTNGRTLKDHLPTDPESGGIWQSAEIYLDASELSGGLPPWRGVT